MRKMEKLKHFKYTLKTHYRRLHTRLVYYHMTAREYLKVKYRYVRLTLDEYKVTLKMKLEQLNFLALEFKDAHLKWLERFLINRKNDLIIMIDNALILYNQKLQTYYGKKIFKQKLKIVKLYEKRKLYSRVKHDPTL